jgi:hypothetical protein
MPSLESIVLYWSAGGNTERVARAAAEGLGSAGAGVTVLGIGSPEADAVELDGFHLVCWASPSYHFGPPAPVRRYVEQVLRRRPARPRAPADTLRWGVAMVTYGGPHTGIDEATPAGEFLAQGLRHVGRQVRGVWYTVGAFHGDVDQENNRLGWLGDIRGRPDEHDLAVIRANARGLAYVLKHELGSGQEQPSVDGGLGQVEPG